MFRRALLILESHWSIQLDAFALAPLGPKQPGQIGEHEILLLLTAHN